MAKRKLDAAAPDHKIPVSAWKKELKELEASYKKEAEKLKPIRDELKELYKIRAITENYGRKDVQHKEEKER